MVDAKFVYLVERLYNREVGLRGVVDVDAAQAGSREQLRACGSYSEDIAGFWMCRIERVKREVLFRLSEVKSTIIKNRASVP